MLFIIWALISASAAFGLDVLSYAVGRKGWRRFASTFVFFYAQIILSEFILGLIGVLSGATLAALNISIVIAILLLTQRKFGLNIYRGYIVSTTRSLKTWLQDIRSDHLFLVLLGLAFLSVAWVIFLGIIMPVTDFDGNAYHMTYIAQAIQNHSILDTPTSIPWLTGYPKGGELIQMWNVMIPRNEALADLAQLPFLLLGIVSLYVISIRLGISRSDARFSSLLFLFLPIVINQTKTTYVDVILCSLFFAASAMATMRKPTRIDLIITGIIYALLLAVKSTGLLFVAATIPFLLTNIILIKNRRVVPNFREYILKLLLVGAPTLFGVYWYIKDLVLYGSPLYPFGLTVGGRNIFPGQTFQDFISSAFSNSSVLPPDMLHRVWFAWTEKQSWYGCLYNYDATFSGLGPLWFVLLMPAIFIGAIIAIRRRNYLFLALSAVLGIMFLLYPANFYSRYTMFVVAIGIFSYGIVSSELGHRLRTFTRLVAIFLALIVIATNFTLCNFSPKVIRSQITAIHVGDPRGGLAYQNSIGSSYLFLQRQVQPNEVVAYDSSPYFIYALWRPDYSNKVIYLPAKNKDEWIMSVKREGVKYVFVNVSSKEHGWIQSGNIFKQIYKDSMYEIYQVN